MGTSFEPWWSSEDIDAGVRAGTARLMWKAYKRESSSSDSTEEDEVAAVGCIEDARARVVAVTKRCETPIVGVVRPGETKVQPRDQRLPAMDLVQPFAMAAEEESAQLVACEIVEWEEASVNPKCRLVEHLGGVGTGVAEHRAVMERYGLTSVEYSEEIEEELKAKLPSSEAVVNAALKGQGPRRWDLRKSHRVVSIDPPSARDLDDALSVEVKTGGRLRIGVHVADVSHFVAAQSHLDREAARRAITVYMPHKTYPMLPRHLSENLCSLLPGEDRLAFSVFFTLDAATGDLCGDEPVAFGKSIIRSSARLSYDEVDAAMGAETKGNAFQIDRAILEDIRLLWDVAAKRNASRGDDTIRVSSSKRAKEFAYEIG
ncbi:Ribonuclease R, putative [Perkinsus marinus ATCC 50983]|uniref:Ribonuclease R, putative n=1 Tax=Perkinsus marinus (strain ATCC 50983 / TXsc) TaxID=423536 RepID=C5KUR4_PERM5|nr:Ribonuclease R, putative [Perkinsus marinus ATCC 50983]EER11785.1 Ribonuclease R, putative [Perkinsus marinus ATCC 50983]|eukprot:XP_002779990.1 Ribonuclease R, putative [Perkinsus marinus ATCC 50983]